MRNVIATAALTLMFVVLVIPTVSKAVAGSGSISGIVTENSGAPIANVEISISGPTRGSTVSADDGTFQFASVPFGVYHMSASKAGYAVSSRDDVTVNGPDTSVTVVMSPVRQIGRIVVHAKAITINTTPASVYQVTAQTFQDQGQIQLRPILEEIPGVSVEIRNGDAYNNGGAIMALGNDTLVTIRGAFSYETATLVDGHALFGGLDNIGFNSAMLNSIGLQRIDTIKGPGASSPTINDAIGGSLNYVTIDPTNRPQGSLSEATDGYGGSAFNFNYSGSTPNGKLGWAIAHGAQATPGGLNHHSNFFQPFSGTVNGQPLGFCFGSDAGPSCSVFYYVQPGVYLGTGAHYAVGYHLIFCCDTERTLGTQFNDFAKVRYHFSPSSTFAVTHMTSTTNNDFGGFQGLQFNGPFVTFPGYSGPVPAFVDEAQPNESTGSQQYQTLNEYDIQTAALHGNLRLSYATFYQFSYYVEQQIKNGPQFLAYGALPTGNPNNPFTFVNGVPVTLKDFGEYTINGYVSLRDYLLQYDLPIKDSLLTFSYDRTAYTPDTGQRCCGVIPAYFYDNENGEYGHRMKARSDQLLLRDTFEPARNLSSTISLYFNRYNSITSSGDLGAAWTGGTTGCGINFSAAHPECLNNPYVVAYYNSFSDHYRYYDAPRLGLTWRPAGDVSWRFAMGGAIAPINLQYSNLGASAPSPGGFNSGGSPTFYTVTEGSKNLYPETAFGYDLGVDRRLPARDMLFSGDVYFTNLYGLFNTITQPEGTFNGLPLIATIYTNIANARYEGIELALRKNPALGFNWQINGALMKAFAYNLPPHFYDTIVPDANGNPVWAPFTNNLAVIAGKNFDDGYFNGGPGDGTEASPYSEGYAEVSYRTSHNGLLLLGATYYGPNNDYFRPAFFVLSASARHDIAPGLTLEASAFNLGDLYDGLLQASYYPTKDGFGVPVALANHTFGLSPGGVVGPRTLKFTLTKSF